MEFERATQRKIFGASHLSFLVSDATVCGRAAGRRGRKPDANHWRLLTALVEPVADRVALLANALLDLADELVHVTFGGHQIVVRHLAPLALDIAFQLVPLAFHSVLIHSFSLLCAFPPGSEIAARNGLPERNTQGPFHR